MDDTPDMALTCGDFIASWGIDVQQFAAFNPGVGSNCENWKLGEFWYS
jgi:hypothetical protein